MAVSPSFFMPVSAPHASLVKSTGHAAWEMSHIMMASLRWGEQEGQFQVWASEAECRLNAYTLSDLDSGRLLWLNIPYQTHT